MPQATIIEITPTQAEKWFDKRADFQRKINDAQVDKLVTAIRKNEWRFNGATIVFNEADELIDGQHRLKAISLAGKCVSSLVVRQVANGEDTFQTIDDQKARKLQDFIQIPNAAVVAAVSRIYWLLLNGAWPAGHSGTVAPLVDVLKLVKKYGGEISSLTEPANPAGRILRQHSFCVFLLFYHAKIKPIANPERMSQFFARVGDGLELTANDPVYRLRKRFFEQANTVAMKRTTAQAIILKALYLYLDEKPCTVIRWEPDREPFPELRGWTGKIVSNV